MNLHKVLVATWATKGFVRLPPVPVFLHYFSDVQMNQLQTCAQLPLINPLQVVLVWLCMLAYGSSLLNAVVMMCCTVSLVHLDLSLSGRHSHPPLAHTVRQALTHTLYLLCSLCAGANWSCGSFLCWSLCARFVLQRSRSPWHVSGLDVSRWLCHGLKLHSRA